MTEKRDYCLKQFIYVMEDKRGLLQKGAKWNTNIKTIPLDTDGNPLVILGKRTEIWAWKELIGFSKDLNTIHGLIMKINNLLQMNDLVTRDNTTVQGCINNMNDIINTFGTLKAKNLMIVDAYGRMTSSPYTTAQTAAVTHCSDQNPTSTILPSSDKSPEEIEEEIEKNQVEMYNALQELQESYFNGEIATEEEYNTRYQAIVSYYEQILAPLVNATRNWLSLEVDDDSLSPMIHLYHNYFPQEGKIIDIDLNGEKPKDNFLSYKPIVDSTGHVVGHDYENITLPYGYKIIKVINDNEGVNAATDKTVESGQIADNTQDTLTFAASNRWIKLDNASEDTIKIGHMSAGDTATTAGDIDSSTPQFGEEFNVPYVQYDQMGHISNSGIRTVTIPKGKLEDSESNNNANVLTSISFTPESGAITIKHQNAGTLLLTGYDGTVSNVNVDIQSSDSINTAFKKLNDRITSLDYTDSGDGNNVVTAINQTDGKISVTHSDIGGLKLKGYESLNEPASTTLAPSDTINNAFGKVDYKIKALQSIINDLDYDDANNTNQQIITKITQTDGKINVERAAAGTLLLTDYILGSNNNPIAATDSINSAFGKLQVQINEVSQLADNNKTNITNLIGETSVSQQIINAFNNADLSQYLTKDNAAVTYQIKGDYITKSQYDTDIAALQATIAELTSRIEALNPSTPTT